MTLRHASINHVVVRRGKVCERLLQNDTGHFHGIQHVNGVVRGAWIHHTVLRDKFPHSRKAKAEWGLHS